MAFLVDAKHQVWNRIGSKETQFAVWWPRSRHLNIVIHLAQLVSQLDSSFTSVLVLMDSSSCWICLTTGVHYCCSQLPHSPALLCQPTTLSVTHHLQELSQVKLAFLRQTGNKVGTELESEADPDWCAVLACQLHIQQCQSHSTWQCDLLVFISWAVAHYTSFSGAPACYHMRWYCNEIQSSFWWAWIWGATIFFSESQ